MENQSLADIIQESLAAVEPEVQEAPVNQEVAEEPEDSEEVTIDDLLGDLEDDEETEEVEHVGDLWFALDHVKDGYSLEPGQHKIHWIVALSSGVFTCVPQDMVLVTETSFTSPQSIPRIKRQSRIWSCE